MISTKNDNIRLGKNNFKKQKENILNDKSSKNTKKATEVSFNILCTYLKTRKIDFNFKI